MDVNEFHQCHSFFTPVCKSKQPFLSGYGIPGGAIRMGDWKLFERYEDGRVPLDQLKDNPGEIKDFAAQFPTCVSSMRQRFHQWYRDTDARFLRSKPNGEQRWQPGNEN